MLLIWGSSVRLRLSGVLFLVTLERVPFSYFVFLYPTNQPYPTMNGGILLHLFLVFRIGLPGRFLRYQKE